MRCLEEFEPFRAIFELVFANSPPSFCLCARSPFIDPLCLQRKKRFALIGCHIFLIHLINLKIVIYCFVNFTNYICFSTIGSAMRLRVLKNGDSDQSHAVIVVGPDLTNVSSYCLMPIYTSEVNGYGEADRNARHLHARV